MQPSGASREGDEVDVANETGSLRLVVDPVRRRTGGRGVLAEGAVAEAGAGAPNVNALNPGERSDMGDSTSVHGVEVTVEPS